MAVSAKTSGTQSTSATTEHTLATITDAGTYVLVVDTADLALGEELILRAKTKVLTGGTSRLAYEAPFRHAQAAPNVYSIPVPVDIEVVFTLEHDAGSGSFPWKVLQLDA